MGTITKGYTFGATETVTSAKLSTLVDSASISNIVATDISSNAITDIKINDVSGAKLTTLSAIPGAAGVIPLANIPSIPGSQLITLSGIPSGSGYIPVANLASIPGTIINNLASLSSQAGFIPRGNISSLFGSTSSGSYVAGSNYQAATDLIVFAYGSVGSTTDSIEGLTDASSPPTTRVVYIEPGVAGKYTTIMFPVRKNDYFKIVTVGIALAGYRTIPIGV